MAAAPDTQQVLYIGGVGRSGSTLLAYLLGQIDGYVVAGELKFIWQNGVKDDDLCGCGEAFSACPFWREVGEVAYGGWDKIDVDEVLRLQAHVTSRRSVAALLAGRAAGPELQRLASLLHPLYRAILAVSGGRVVVDTSKTPAEALVLANVPGFDCRAIHLVRDSRGVAFSWAKKGVRRPERADAEAVMLDYRPLYIAPRWLYGNLMFELMRKRLRTTRLRYEDLVSAPREQVEVALQRCGLPASSDELAALTRGSVELGTLHTIGGNPMRFTRGEAPVRGDEKWRTEMAPRARRGVAAVTWPLLRLYGYRLTPGARSRPGGGERLRAPEGPSTNEAP